MNEFIEKLKAIEGEISKEKGDFVLFAAFERDEAPGRWDLIVSAPWIGDDKRGIIEALADRITARFTPKELVSLSRILVLEPSDGFVQAVNSVIRNRHMGERFANTVLDGVPIAQAFVITSDRAPLGEIQENVEIERPVPLTELRSSPR